MDNQGLEHITEIEIKLQKAESAIYYLKEEIKAYEEAVLHVKTLMPETYDKLENSSFFNIIHFHQLEHKHWETIQDKIDSGEYKVSEYDSNDEQPH
jgi:ppGpp synthetase/RelA/SpoT-type nucleotidyltranferase